MPEGPELYLSAEFASRSCTGLVFQKIVKSPESKNPEVRPWGAENVSKVSFTLSASSRGKEIILQLSPIHSKLYPVRYVLLHFGMSGKFEVCAAEDIPKHAHLQFHSADGKRRFGNWECLEAKKFDTITRGPCVIEEPDVLREHILHHLAVLCPKTETDADDATSEKYRPRSAKKKKASISINKDFDKPIAVVLLNQKYFNGIGNYLRAEIMYRAGANPFQSAREVILERLNNSSQDIISLAHQLPKEVVDNDKKDSNKRMVWFAKEQVTSTVLKESKLKKFAENTDDVDGGKTSKNGEKKSKKSTTLSFEVKAFADTSVIKSEVKEKEDVKIVKEGVKNQKQHEETRKTTKQLSKDVNKRRPPKRILSRPSSISSPRLTRSRMKQENI